MCTDESGQHKAEKYASTTGSGDSYLDRSMRVYDRLATYMDRNMVVGKNSYVSEKL